MQAPVEPHWGPNADRNGDGFNQLVDHRKPDAAGANEAVTISDAINDANVFVVAESNRPLRKAHRDGLKPYFSPRKAKGLVYLSQADTPMACPNGVEGLGTTLYFRGDEARGGPGCHLRTECRQSCVYR